MNKRDSDPMTRLAIRLATIALLLTLLGLVVTSKGQTIPNDPLFAAICQVESRMNPDAVGDSGRARGYAQCWRGAWYDGCKQLGVRWDYATGVKDYARSQAIFYAYTSRYGAGSQEQRARAWNAGPGWRHKIKATDGYWHKVQTAMERAYGQ